MDASRLASYVLEDKLHRNVAGWLNEGAISAVIAFANWQYENNVLGDVAEIGVHHGKFFLVLANLRRQQERAFAIDVFDEQHLNPDNSGRGDLASFTENLRLYGTEAGVTIIRKDSKALTRNDFYRGNKSRIRLFSVDGSHTAGHTRSDLAIAAQLIAADGLIILDDFYNPDWPGVQEGFYQFFSSADREVAPFAYGNNKLFLCKATSHPRYLNFVESNLRPFFLHYKEVTIGNYRVVHLSLPGPELLFQPDLSFIPNVFPLRGPALSPRVSFGAGWAGLQSNGIWTQGPRSELTLKLMPSPSPTALSIDLEPFLHEKRTVRHLSVTLNGRHLGRFAFRAKKSKRLEVLLPTEILHSGCELLFDIEEPDRPSETIGTQDHRALGFFFQQIRLI